MCIQCFLSVSRFCNQQRHLHHQQLGCICIAFLMPFLSGRQATVLQFELCVGLIPENVLTPRSGSYERNLNEQLSTGCLMQAWHTETFFFTFRNVWEGRESRPFTCFQSCRSFSWCCPSSLLAVSCTCRFQTSGPPCNRRALSCFCSCYPTKITFYKVLDLNCFVSSDSCSSFLADSRSFPSSSSSTVISASIPTFVGQIEFKVVFTKGPPLYHRQGQQ